MNKIDVSTPKRPRYEYTDSSDNEEKSYQYIDDDLQLTDGDSEHEEQQGQQLINDVSLIEQPSLQELDSDSTTSISLDITANLELKYHIPEWSINGELRTIDFIKRQEFDAKLPPNPIDYFLFFVEENFLSTVCQETNRYAKELFCSEKITPQSRITSWKEITVAELKIFIGLLLHMGTIQLPRLQDYWKTNRLFNIRIFTEQMSRNRFLLIFRCLHFTSKTDETDPLIKIRNVIDYFNTKMSSCYYPSRELTLDEYMILWRGRLKFPKNIKNRSKYGLKLYMLTEPNGTILNLCVYEGINDIDIYGKEHTDQVVMKLLEGKLQNGHSLYISKYYNNYNLVKKLLDNNTYCTGILQKASRENPNEIRKKILKKGQNISMYCDNVHIGKWSDKRSTIYITSEYENKMDTITNKKGQLFTKPNAIIQYNKYMLGIDRQDQMMAFYPCERQTLLWYKKLFVHILQLLLINSHKIYNKYSGSKIMSLYDYRLAIVSTLLQEKVIHNPKARIIAKARSSVHVISKIMDKSHNRVKRKVCRLCSKAGKRKDTIYHCLHCENHPGLCMECFDTYHTLHVYD